MTGRPGLGGEQGAIPFVLIGVAALTGVLGLAWAGQEWAQTLLAQAGGELTVWVLRGAFWALDLIAAQAAATPIHRDWYTPVLDGPALPIYALAALVTVATLIAETVAGMVTGNTPRIVQAVIRALVAGMLATAGGALLLSVAGALSNLGRLALETSGAGVDAPLVPLQEVLMDSALQRDTGVELFVVFLAGLVIVFCSLAIYFTLAMRPVLLAALIVFLPVAHALSVWSPLRRVQIRAWALAFAVLLADAAILTMFAVTNTVMGQPEGVDRLVFGTFGLLLAALAPAALARIIGTPELHTAVQSMSRGSRMAALGVGAAAVKGALLANRLETGLQNRPPTLQTGPAGGATPAGGSLDGGGGGGGGGPSGGRAGGPPGAAGPAQGSRRRSGRPGTAGAGAGVRPAATTASGAAAAGSSAAATGRSATIAGSGPGPSGAGSDAAAGPAQGSRPASGWAAALTAPPTEGGRG